MKRHLAYLRYVIRHKWFVFLACRKFKAPFVASVIHDWSKFLPSEWLPYARTFYKPNGEKQYEVTDSFWRAWLHHQHLNPHHWQHWCLRKDDGSILLLEMPERYAREMVADWSGAGKAIHGRDELKEWYEKNRDVIQLHDKTRTLVERLLSYVNPTERTCDCALPDFDEGSCFRCGGRQPLGE